MARTRADEIIYWAFELKKLGNSKPIIEAVKEIKAALKEAAKK